MLNWPGLRLSSQTQSEPLAEPEAARETTSGDAVPLLGIASMFLAVFLFSTVNALVKWLSEAYPVQEILMFRTAFALVPCALLLGERGARASLKTTRMGAHLVRGLLGIGALALLFVSFTFLPLADATAVYFSAPLFVAALSWPLLREPVAWDRWLAVAIGFVGVMLVLGPSGQVLGIATLVPLAASLLLALSLIMSRRLSRTEPTAVIAFYFTFISALAVAPFAPIGWVTPSPLDAVLLAMGGIAGGLGIYLLTYAYRLAPASTVAPLDYLAVVWAAAFGYWLWDDLPGWTLVVGAVLIAGGGAYVVCRATVTLGGVPSGRRPNSSGRA